MLKAKLRELYAVDAVDNIGKIEERMVGLGKTSEHNYTDVQ